MSLPEHQPCEVPGCGHDATSSSRDLREVEPVLDSDGAFLWVRYEPAGGWHPRCNEHPRISQTFDRDGQVVVRAPVEA